MALSTLDRQGLVRKLAAVPDAFTGRGTMASRQPGYTEGVIDWLSRNVFGDDRAGREKAEWLTGGVTSLPGVSELGDAYSVGQDLGQGNYLGAGLGLAMAGLPGPSPKKIKAFHSSPHDFEKFDINKVGTGQGAQSYGHGIYAAESPAVSGKGGEYYNEFSRKFQPDTPEGKAFEYMKNAGQDRTLALSMAEQDVAYYDRHRIKDDKYKTPGMRDFSAEKHDAALAARELLASDKIIGPRTYEVEINADPESFLDWDRPLSEQSAAVRERLKPQNLGLNPAGPVGEKGYYGYTDEGGKLIGTAQTGGLPEEIFSASAPGSDVYRGGGSWTKEQATKRLREAGIPGIRYLDQGSRGYDHQVRELERQIAESKELSGAYTYDDPVDNKAFQDRQLAHRQHLQERLANLQSPTRNYVLFDDKLISILKKYGLIGLLGGGAAAATATQSPEASANPLDNQGLVRRLNRGRE